MTVYLEDPKTRLVDPEIEKNLWSMGGVKEVQFRHSNQVRIYHGPTLPRTFSVTRSYVEMSTRVVLEHFFRNASSPRDALINLLYRARADVLEEFQDSVQFLVGKWTFMELQVSSVFDWDSAWGFSSSSFLIDQSATHLVQAQPKSLYPGFAPRRWVPWCTDGHTDCEANREMAVECWESRHARY